MNENNFIDEAQISELYGDIVDAPVEVAGIGDWWDCVTTNSWGFLKKKCY